MPLTRRLSQFFSSSPSLPLPGKDMHTDDTDSPKPTSSPPSISEEVIITSSIAEENEGHEDNKEPGHVSVEQLSHSTKRPRRKTIRKIFRRFSFQTLPKDSRPASRNVSQVHHVFMVETPPHLPALTTTTDVPPLDIHEPIDYTRIEISSLPFPFPELASPLRESLNTDPKLNCSDSGYFSLACASSSSLSPALPSPTLQLIRRINKAILLLEYQELLTTRFSTNLAYLFGKKEMAIWRTRKLSDDTKELIIITLTKLRELVGKTMVHKMGLVRRSRSVLGEAVEAIISSRRRDSGVETETPTAETPSETPSENCLETPSESSEPALSPEITGTSRTQTKLEVQAKMRETLQILRDDIGMQRRLDEVLRAGIVGSCGDERLMMGLPSRSERLCLRRFVGFVEGRVTELGGAYGRVEKAVGGLERSGYENVVIK